MEQEVSNACRSAIPAICRRHIGDYLGLTLETASRALSQLSDRGILVFSSARQIVLHDRQRLADMEA
jgi:CRP/FNR family transcriptional regulator, nitrogen fixation regulation protein